MVNEPPELEEVKECVELGEEMLGNEYRIGKSGGGKKERREEEAV